MNNNIPVLSVKPPWAYFIIYGILIFEAVDNGDGTQRVQNSGKILLKNVENRTWTTGYRGRLRIHVGKKEEPIKSVLDFFTRKGLAPISAMAAYSKSLPRGAIIGEVDLVDVVTDSPSPWAAAGQYHWKLDNREVYPSPVYCRGKLGLFRPEVK